MFRSKLKFEKMIPCVELSLRIKESFRHQSKRGKLKKKNVNINLCNAGQYTAKVYSIGIIDVIIMSSLTKNDFWAGSIACFIMKVWLLTEPLISNVWKTAWPMAMRGCLNLYLHLVGQISSFLVAGHEHQDWGMWVLHF